VENIKDYARNYDQMTDAKADELIQKSMEYQKQRAELLARRRPESGAGAVNRRRDPAIN
jgi:hypothetical protein